MLHGVEGKATSAAMQGLITATRFKCEIAATRPRIASDRRKPPPRPRFKLFDRNGAQGAMAGAETCKCSFTVEAPNFFRQRKDPARKFDRVISICISAEQANEARTAANEGY